jgi:heme exporter protein B
MWYLSFARDLKIFRQNSNLWLLSLVFYLIIVLSAPIVLTNTNIKLVDFAPVIIWLTFMLASIQLITNIFVVDYRNGWYQQVFINIPSPTRYFLLKMLATTLVFILPVIGITPVLALAYDLTWRASVILCLGLLMAAPAVCFVSAIFAALTVSSHQRAGLLSIMVLPLCVPIYILGVGSCFLFSMEMNPYPSIALLAAISIFAMLGAPYLISLSIRNGFEY